LGNRQRLHPHAGSARPVSDYQCVDDRGGILHVPLLVGVVGFPVHVATARSHFVLANMALAGSVTHVVTGAFPGGTGMHRAIALSIGVIGGAQVGEWLSQRLRGTTIQRLLALGLAVLSLRLLIGAV